MPYIKQEDRLGLTMHWTSPATPGALNFLLTTVCLEYLKAQGLQYRTLNDIVGVLECTKQEFYRRVAAPYEDRKSKEHGDVY